MSIHKTEAFGLLTLDISYFGNLKIDVPGSAKCFQSLSQTIQSYSWVNRNFSAMEPS